MYFQGMPFLGVLGSLGKTDHFSGHGWLCAFPMRATDASRWVRQKGIPSPIPVAYSMRELALDLDPGVMPSPLAVMKAEFTKDRRGQSGCGTQDGLRATYWDLKMEDSGGFGDVFCRSPLGY